MGLRQHGAGCGGQGQGDQQLLHGVLSGRVEKFLDPKTKADAVCEKCTDDRAGKPVLGMTIIRGAKADGDRQHRGSADPGA